MRRIKFLDGLKGLGAIGVFLCHYNMFNFPAPTWFRSTLIETWFMSGGYAVAVFLIVSGILAWMSIQQKLNDEISVSKTIVNRYFRFAIPFGIVFIILYLTNSLGFYSYHVQAGEILKSEPLKTAFWQVDIVGFCKSLILSPIFSDFWDSPLWMMRYVFLSTYFALLFALATKVMRKDTTILFLLFALILFSILDIFFFGVLIGIIIAYFYINYNEHVNKYPLSQRYFLGFSCLMLTFLSRYYLNGNLEFINFTSGTFLILSVYFLPFFKKILESFPLQYLGKISFGLFIWHWPILCSLTSFLFVITGEETEYATEITLFSTFLCVIIVSHLSEKYIEKTASNYITAKIMNFIYRES